MNDITPEQLEAEADTFFSEVLPGVLDGVRGSVARARAWRGALFDAGLAGLDYPVEYGGRGLDPNFRAAFAAGAAGRTPPEDTTFGIGIGMALPVIRDHGSDSLKSQLLADGLSGKHIWCQLYSEPGSGSDLASLSTKAVLDGDEWVVSGQKVWTSGAHNADIAILLARTNPDAPKHRGITMFVLPMHQKEITVRPLKQMTGAEEFNEVFMDEARLPRDWVVGEVNNGWRMAVALLAHERVQTGVASVGRTVERSKAGRNPIPVKFLTELAESRGRLDDPVIRQELAGLYAGERVVGFLRDRGGIHPSIGKLWRTRQGRAAADFAARVCFPASPAWSYGDEEPDYFAYHVLNCRGMSLGGGTDEIQRNTIGEQALGLPREPAIDKDVPFKDTMKSRAGR
jgi:alkylation response protein AidB-like acyl-CoA dehydrogenase